VTLKERFWRLAGPRADFHPAWGPLTALVWVLGIFVGTVLIGLAADSIGLIALTSPDGKENLTPLLLVSQSLQIPLVVIVASRLKLDPLDVLALRLPASALRRAAVGLVSAIVIAIVAAIAALAILIVLNLLFPDAELFSEDAPADDGVPPEADPKKLDNQQLIERDMRQNGLALSLLSIGLIGPVSEELLFRGLLLLSFFRTRLWFWGAAAISSALFAFAHNPAGLDVLALVPYFCFGLVYALALRWTGSLWVPIGLHVLQNSIVAFRFFS
jgi:membrane protease YdiL (CAAX protease family)